MSELKEYTIRPALVSSDWALAKALFKEYAEWLKVDLCFQGFREELATLPGAYAPPGGSLLLVGESPDTAFGCVALRPLEHEIAEIKRLYVRDSYRSAGWGRALTSHILDQARMIGYRSVRLDTLEFMDAARALYASFGFKECASYYRNPLPGVVYMELAL